MTYKGTVQNGVIQLEAGVQLPEGAEVQVELNEEAPSGAGETDDRNIWQKLEDLGRWAETQPCDLPTDLAENHDHYLHGTPKRQ